MLENESKNIETAHPNLKVIFGVIFLGFILAYIVTLISFNYFPKIQLLVGELFIIIPSGIYVLFKKYNLRNVFRLYSIDKKLVVVSALLGMSLVVINDEIDRIVRTFMEIPPEFEELLMKLLKADSLLEWVILVLSAVVLASIIEEMLFRGMLQKAFESRIEFSYAIFFSASIFALLHPIWFIQVLILGLILGYLAWRSNSIIPCIILHCFNNAIALWMTNTDPTKLNWYDWNGHVNPAILAVAACFTFYGFKWFYFFTKSDA